jgi:hypothetical protein
VSFGSCREASPEERWITREVIRIIAELPDDLDIRDAVPAIPDVVPEALQARIRKYEPYLRWAAGKEANAWLSGGPAYIPPGPGPNGSDNTSRTPRVPEGRLGNRTGAERGVR